MSARRLTSVRLVAGASDQAGWTLTEADGRALFRVGSAEECNWRVIADGVAPHQFMLMWNGAELTIIDVGGGAVRIDGRALEGTAIVRSGRIEFGDAAMEVKSAGGAGVVFNGLAESSVSLQGPTWAPGAPRTGAPASMSDVLTVATPTRRGGGSHPRLVAARATEVMDVPPASEPERPRAAKTRAPRRSGSTMTLPAAEALPEVAPDVGRPLPPGAYAPTAPLGSRRADGQGVSVPSLTIGRRTPEAAPLCQTRAPAGTPPSMPAQARDSQVSAAPEASSQQPVAAAPRASTAAPPPAPSPAPTAPPPPAPAAETPPPAPPPAPAAETPPPAPAAVTPPSPPPPALGATRAVAAPAIAAPTISHRSAAGKARRSLPSSALKATRVPEPVRGPELPPPPPKRRLPARTWALLAVTAAAGVGLLVMRGGTSSAAAAGADPAQPPERAEPAPKPPPPAALAGASDIAPAAALAGSSHDAPESPPTEPADPSDDAPEEPPAEAAAPVSLAALDLVDEADPLATAHCTKDRRRRRCEPHTRERVAADLLAEGRRAEAAERYRRLAVDTGDQRFAILADILTPPCTAESCP